ncbi:MAG: hypothetical protein HZB66_01710 [Candidatus Aenigmarchaeota archaeon]|nr:hypothetical protein [Candidatus Aenigmarchaeota archaeon]
MKIRKISVTATLLAAMLFPSFGKTTGTAERAYVVNVERVVGGIASYYGKGTRSDPKPISALRRFDDFYGSRAWNYFCAMPDTKIRGRPVLTVNRKNGMAAVVVVADYGPNQRVHPERKIDNSDHVAKELEYKRDGVVPSKNYVIKGKIPLGPIESYRFDSGKRRLTLKYF